MDFDVFRKNVMDEMRERFPNLEFGSREMKKLQGESYVGLMVTIPGSKVSASLNLDPTMSAPTPVLPSIR